MQFQLLLLVHGSLCRMLYGFSRDGAVPFSDTWTQVDKASGVPLHAGTAVSRTIVCLLDFHAWIRSLWVALTGLQSVMLSIHNQEVPSAAFHMHIMFLSNGGLCQAQVHVGMYNLSISTCKWTVKLCAVWAVTAGAFITGLPLLQGSTAFLANTSIATVGLALCYGLPIGLHIFGLQ